MTRMRRMKRNFCETTGKHSFLLIKHKWIAKQKPYKEMSIAGFYKRMDEEMIDSKSKHPSTTHLRSWECYECGLIEQDTEEKPKKKIRNNLFEYEKEKEVK